MKRMLLVLSVALVMAAMLAVMAAPAFAKITPASCENQGGNLPPGQQPVCEGEGLTQNPATNPAGHAPPGQQP
jgi:hypothetical protein